MTGGFLIAAAILLEPDSALTFEATIPEGENVVVSLGRGREKLVVSSKDNAYPWSYTGVDGAKPTERAYPGGSRPLETSPYWWEKTDYTPNGRYRRTFALPPTPTGVRADEGEVAVVAFEEVPRGGAAVLALSDGRNPIAFAIMGAMMDPRTRFPTGSAAVDDIARNVGGRGIRCRASERP